jgi:uncharacterized protein DUF1918
MRVSDYPDALAREAREHSVTREKGPRMSPGTAAEQTHPGDLVVIAGHRVGDRGRIGEILEVVGERRYRVRWDDGHESTFCPGSDAVIRHQRRDPSSKSR